MARRRKVEDIEGVGPAYAEKLARAGVQTTAQLLERAATPRGRDELAQGCDVSPALILKWANHADLMRVNGIGPQYSELLEAAGVDTVKELRNRNAENLAAKAAEINGVKKLVRVVPSVKSVTRWIEQAKALTPVMQY